MTLARSRTPLLVLSLSLALSVFGNLAGPANVFAQQTSSGTTAPPVLSQPTTGTTTSSSSSSSGGTSLNDVCGTTLQQAANPTAAESGSMTFTQKVTYCQAAQQASKAAGDDGLLWKVWAGVAGICTVACITSFTGAEHLKMICTATNVGASVTSAVMTQNMSSALMGLAPTAIGFITKGKKPDLAACLTAATATIQVFTDRKDETTQQQTENTNLQAAIALGNDPTGSSSSSGVPGSVIVPTTNTQPNTVAAVSGNPALTVEQGATGLAQDGKGSGGCGGGGTSDAMLACALAADSNLPGFVTSPAFQAELGKNTGLTPSQFLGNSGLTPAQSILGASGGAGLNPAGLQNYASLLGDTAKQFDGDAPSSTYAGGGGGGGTGAGNGNGEDTAITAAMAGLMKQLNPGGGAEKEKTDGNSLNVVFQSGNREPAYNADDPSFSIFERVSVRYRYVSQRLFR